MRQSHQSLVNLLSSDGNLVKSSLVPRIEARKMGKTEWICEQCGQSGVIEYDRNIDVWTMFQRIYEDHSKKNAECKFDRDKVRVLIVDDKYG